MIVFSLTHPGNERSGRHGALEQTCRRLDLHDRACASPQGVVRPARHQGPAPDRLTVKTLRDSLRAPFMAPMHQRHQRQSMVFARRTPATIARFDGKRQTLLKDPPLTRLRAARQRSDRFGASAGITRCTDCGAAPVALIPSCRCAPTPAPTLRPGAASISASVWRARWNPAPRSRILVRPRQGAGDPAHGQFPPGRTPARRSRSARLSDPIEHRAITRSKDLTRPLRPFWVRHTTVWPFVTRTSAALAAGPFGSRSSGALKSANRTSIQSLGSALRPTQRLSPSPTWRTVPAKMTPARSGSGPSQGSAEAGPTRQARPNMAADA